MNAELATQLALVAETVRRFGLVSLAPTVRACEALLGDCPIDVAVLGQFKSGKSSLLNAILGVEMLPIGILPVTAVVTRIAAGAKTTVRVTYLNGKTEEVSQDNLADFVTEAGNPENRRRVAVADILAPALGKFPQLRLVDTPGLGSTLSHNTDATRDWMPNLTAAIVAVSVERPLSAQDLELVADARRIASSVGVVLTKVDLLTDAEQKQVLQFIGGKLRSLLGSEIPVFAFSTRTETNFWLKELGSGFLQPLAGNANEERNKSLAVKLYSAVETCRSYLFVALQAAERTDVNDFAGRYLMRLGTLA